MTADDAERAVMGDLHGKLPGERFLTFFSQRGLNYLYLSKKQTMYFFM
jgi:hypothetical protein